MSLLLFLMGEAYSQYVKFQGIFWKLIGEICLIDSRFPFFYSSHFTCASMDMKYWHKRL